MFVGANFLRGGPRRSTGVSLIEVLVSLVILSLGMLSVVGLQLVSKRNMVDSGQRTIAAQLAYDLIERMRTNSANSPLSAYLTGSDPLGRGSKGDTEPSPACTSSSPCTPAELVAHDLWDWEQTLDGAAEQIGSAKTGGMVFPTACIDGPVSGGDGIYTITIAWRGGIELPNNAAVTCGSGATDAGGNRVYGNNDQFRRTLSVPVFITARPV